jgi:hypothetical protein
MLLCDADDLARRRARVAAVKANGALSDAPGMP